MGFQMVRLNSREEIQSASQSLDAAQDVLGQVQASQVPPSSQVPPFLARSKSMAENLQPQELAGTVGVRQIGCMRWVHVNTAMSTDSIMRYTESSQS